MYHIPNRKGSTGITGYIVCPNVIMIFVENYNRRLVIPNEDGILEKEIHCSLRHQFDVIICACFAVIVLITTDGELSPINTDPNVFRVDNISFIFALMLYLKLS
jgi:hypothetical protein